MNQRGERQGSWQPEWLTIREFERTEPVNLLHKEQEPGADAGEAEPDRMQNVHVLVRAHFFLPEVGGRSGEGGTLRLKITADDHYKLYSGERFLGEGPAPAYPSHYYYNQLTLENVTPGEHVLALHLYYQGLVNRVYNSGDLRFGFAMELQDQQGGSIPLTFRCRKLDCYQGETIGYETQFLENFDSRGFPERWREKDYPDEQWEVPVPAQWADYALFPQPTEMLCHMERKARRIEKREDGSIFLDAGGEVTGALCLRALGHAGDQVEILCGEELEETGSVRYEMRCNCVYREVWTLREGISTLEPYDYKGFRYAEIRPARGVEIRDVTICVRHYPMEEGRCTVESSEKALEEIFSICKNAVRLGTQEGYLDCPTREKGQYLGDAIVTAHAQVLLTGKTEMLLKCIDQFAQTAQICPGLMAVAPGGLMQEIGDFSLLYSQLLLLYYRFTGDKRTVGRYYDTAKGILDHFSRHERKDGLLDQVADKWNLVDWPENLRDNYDFPLTRPVVGKGCHNVINALYLGAMKTLNRLAQILGRPQEYGPELEIRLKAYHHAFYREETGLLADSEISSHSAVHSNVYALYFGLLPENEEERVISFLGEKGFSCGVMLSYYILLALARRKRYDLVYQLLMNEGEHGWKNMIREGASTCFEAWGKEQKWNTSLCHPWASAPVPVILEEIAGIHIDPDSEDGFYFEPHIPEEVEYFRAEVQAGGKKITVIKKEGRININGGKEYTVSKGK